MNHRGKLLFVLACGLLGVILSLTLLPPVVEGIGQEVFARMRTEEAKRLGPTPVAESVRPKNEQSPSPEREQSQESESGTANTDSGLPEAGTDSATESPAGAGDTEPVDPGVQNQRSAGSIVNPNAAGPDEEVAVTRFNANPYALGLFGFIVGLSFGGFLLRQGEKFVARWEKSPSGDKITIMLGTFAGVLAGILVSMPFYLALQGRPEGALLTIGMVVGCSAAMIYLLRSLGPYLPWETSSTSKRTGLKVLDTNVLIDGRVYDLIRIGFLDGDLYVPQFVLLELQHIADSADGLRRQRGRRGLDILNRIRAEFEVEVGTRDRYAGNEKDEVDTRLMKLCKSLGADLVSNDYNLNRTATVQDIHVLNINDLALALRPNVLPGEPLLVQVMKEGNQAGQGVGYLDDGTMVVVEGGFGLIGLAATDVTVTQVIQTERGKMIFAEAEGAEGSSHEAAQRRRSPRGQR